LQPELRGLLLSSMNEDEMPSHAYYGDGSSIHESVIEAILDAYNRVAVPVEWEAGDVLMLDNILTAHGRAAFVGERKILVAMTKLVSGGDVAEESIKE
jgi:hypothetical protein